MWKYGEITRQLLNSFDLFSTLCEVMAYLDAGRAR
jgi:hypothetical protein